jgi:hypothetical protein
MRPPRAAAASAVVSTLMAGCWSELPVISSDVSTHDITAHVIAVGDADGTTVSASLLGPKSYVILVDDDRLLLRVGGAEVGMTRLPDEDAYEASLVAGAVDLELQLQRSPPNEAAEIAIGMPPATALTTVPQASRQAPITVTWTANDGPQMTTLSVSGTCLPATSRMLAIDPGTYTFLPADLAGASTETCTATVILTRALVVQATPPPLMRTYVSATQTATTSFESTP